MLRKRYKLLVMTTIALAGVHTTGMAQYQPHTPCDSKVLSYANWKETPKTEWSLNIAAQNGGSLQYIGAAHSDDYNHKQFQSLHHAWEAQKPTIAFFEGPDRGIAPSEEETIKQFGESGFVRHLAKAHGIKAQSLEPGPQDEVNYLLSLKKFTPEQIKLFFILREASRLRERKGMNEEQIKATIAQIMAKANTMVPEFADVLPNVESLQPAYNKFWSAPSNWWEAPASWFTPGGDGEKTGGKFTNEINRHSSEFRDLYMYRLLTNAVLRGERVFAVVGRNHVPMQEQAIRCALK